MLSPRVHNLVSYSGAAACFLLASGTSAVNWLAFSMWVGHFLRRTLETLFLFNFSGNSVPLADSIQEFVYYWVFAVAVARSLDESSLAVPVSQKAAACLMWLGCEWGNFQCHRSLAGLASTKSAGRRSWVPAALPYLFDRVTCPHYFFEISSWICFNLATGSQMPSLIFCAVGATIMTCWAVQRHEQYVKLHLHYPKQRTPICPGVDIRPPTWFVALLER
jgi:very-long-chain enoyl-CoA reductase